MRSNDVNPDGGVNPRERGIDINSILQHAGKNLALDFPELLLSHSPDSLLISWSSNQ